MPEWLINLPWLVILSVSNLLFLVTIAVLAVVLRGAISSQEIDPEFEPRALTGREREEIRRRMVNIGTNVVTSDDVLNLLYTIRQIELGNYTDDDVYIPDDPYRDERGE